MSVSHTKDSPVCLFSLSEICFGPLCCFRSLLFAPSLHQRSSFLADLTAFQRLREIIHMSASFLMSRGQKSKTHFHFTVSIHSVSSAGVKKRDCTLWWFHPSCELQPTEIPAGRFLTSGLKIEWFGGRREGIHHAKEEEEEENVPGSI